VFLPKYEFAENDQFDDIRTEIGLNWNLSPQNSPNKNQTLNPHDAMLKTKFIKPKIPISKNLKKISQWSFQKPWANNGVIARVPEFF
jgi:hypothetical protein